MGYQRIDWRELQEYISRRQLWLNVFQELIPNELGNALTKFSPSNHGNAKTFCPDQGHGSSSNTKKTSKATKSKNTSGKAFGLLPRAAETGGSVCNSCGPQSNGFATLMFCTGWSFGETIRAVSATKTVGWIKTDTNYSGPVKPLRQWVKPPIDQQQEEKKVAKNQALLDACYTLDHPKAELARKYFINRGVQNTPLFAKDVVFHPALPYWCKLFDTSEDCLSADYTMLTKLPALVSKIRQPCGKYVNLHITYFYHDGTKAKEFLWKKWCIASGLNHKEQSPDFKKKHQPDVKKLRSRIEHLPIKGGGLHVTMPAPLLAVSEGLENIASFMESTSIQCWGLLNATMMRSWVPPSGTKAVLILADHDEAGLKAAVKLYDRLKKMGIYSFIITPFLLELGDEPDDWNDAYISQPRDTFSELFNDEFIQKMLQYDYEPLELPAYAYED